jgi:hypothetical protein
MKAKVKCPTCQKEIEWSPLFPYRPFCSERCKLIDLGAWASGEFAIAGEPATPLDEHYQTEDPKLH